MTVFGQNSHSISWWSNREGMEREEEKQDDCLYCLRLKTIEEDAMMSRLRLRDVLMTLVIAFVLPVAVVVVVVGDDVGAFF